MKTTVLISLVILTAFGARAQLGMLMGSREVAQDAPGATNHSIYNPIGTTNYLKSKFEDMNLGFQPTNAWFSNGVTNLVIGNDFKGTIQVGTNFYTVKDFQKGWREMDEFQLDMAEARGRLQAYRDVSLNRVQISNIKKNIVEFHYNQTNETAP